MELASRNRERERDESSERWKREGEEGRRRKKREEMEERGEDPPRLARLSSFLSLSFSLSVPPLGAPLGGCGR